MTPLQREALQMCLEYIETNAHERRHVRWKINEALAEPQPEPVLLNGLTEAETNSTASVVGLTLSHAPCLGMDCGITRTDQIHSAECQAEHAAAIAGGKFVKPAQPQQEPVAWRVKWPAIGGGHKWLMVDRPLMEKEGFVNEALYTSPPARKPLTDEEIETVWRSVQANDFHDCVKPFARAIEAKHNIKENT